MNKSEFLEALSKRLKAFPEEERDRFVTEYSDKIDDLINDGMSEEDAVASIGDAGDIALKLLVENEDLIPKDEKNDKPLVTTAYYKGDAKESSSTGDNRRRNQSGNYESYDDYRRAPEKKGGSSAAKIILIIICFPFIIAAAATAFGLFMGACGLTFGLLAAAIGVAVGFIAAGVGSVIGFIVSIMSGRIAVGLATLGAGFVLAGIGLLLFPVVKAISKVSVSVIKSMFGFIGKLFRGRTA